jgi:MFS family permease
LNNTDIKINRKSRPFYGWFALAGLMLIIFVMSGAFVNSFGVFLPVICDKMEWSRATVAMALSIGIMSFGLPGPLFGILINKFGPRAALIFGNLLAALGIGCLSLVQEIWQVYLLYVVIGVGAGFGGYIASSTVANNWFIKKRSLAMGLFSGCGALGGFAFPPLATSLIASVGWRFAWVIMAGIVVIGVVVGGVILVRNKPEDMGQVPDGARTGSYTEIAAPNTIAGRTETQAGGMIKQLVKRPVIWLIAGFAAVNAFGSGAMSTHQVAYVQDIGFTAMTAATTMSVMSVFMAIGSVSFGALGLIWDARKLAIVSFTLQLIALIVLITSRQLGLIYVYALLLGLGNGAISTAMPTITGIHFGREQYAQALGVIVIFQVGAQSVAAYVAGAIYDASGSYTPAFIVVAACIVLGMVFTGMIRPPKKMVT